MSKVSLPASLTADDLIDTTLFVATYDSIETELRTMETRIGRWIEENTNAGRVRSRKEWEDIQKQVLQMLASLRAIPRDARNDDSARQWLVDMRQGVQLLCTILEMNRNDETIFDRILGPEDDCWQQELRDALIVTPEMLCDEELFDVVRNRAYAQLNRFVERAEFIRDLSRGHVERYSEWDSMVDVARSIRLGFRERFARESARTTNSGELRKWLRYIACDIPNARGVMEMTRFRELLEDRLVPRHAWKRYEAIAAVMEEYERDCDEDTGVSLRLLST
ncbi:hypothetical protein EXIGLDRAFT_772667 [Exidia glandulosa HHB12029]|uniref:Uncharacterized protein n=1 Tax=Exidia glandulosa HHB12029 TaxID=1314781 RepID=A0A165BK83_EXIGL|nr:hypothetical protein EXIGLDRAFT_780535 [Exidia glandulosa HHB12029]KZV88471.1 hypothetical protein EXIGLDRAFT_772667 [Exidia glandulosa HHB12029]